MFVPAPPLRDADVQRIVEMAAHRLVRLLQQRGVLQVVIQIACRMGRHVEKASGGQAATPALTVGRACRLRWLRREK